MRICKQCDGDILNSQDRRNVFCSVSCAATYNNCLRRNRLTHTYVCEKCGKEFTTKYAKKAGRKLHCKKCTRATSSVAKENLVSLKQLSKRTVSKILRRLRLGCGNCGWNECVGDIHHILSVKLGGGDSHDNLTYLCPNCHRKAHSRLPVKLLPLTELLPKNWRDYYYGIVK